MSVRVLRLRSGEDIIAEVKSSGDEWKDANSTTLELKNPQAMLMQPVGPGKMSFNFLPFFPFVGKGKTIKLEKSFVVVNEEPDPEILNVYNTNFGSGLTIADASALSDLAGKRIM